MDVLTAARMLATANTATAPSNAGLRPQISLHFAQIGPDAAFANKYALPIQVYPAADFSEAEIVGIAVAMIVWSSAAMKKTSYGVLITALTAENVLLT
jgi:hypothetical protein